MACGTTSPPVTKLLHTSTTVEQFEPFSSWQPAVGLDKVKMVVKRRSVNLAGTSPVLTLKPVDGSMSPVYDVSAYGWDPAAPAR